MADEQNTIPPADQGAYGQQDATVPIPPRASDASAASEPPVAPEPADVAQGYAVTSYTMPVSSADSVQGATPTPGPVSQPTAPMPEYHRQSAATPPTAPIPPTPQPSAGVYQEGVPFQPVPEPLYQQAVPLSQLTGGMKFGWLVVGLLMGIPGMLVAWLANVDKHPQVKKDAIMWSVIGFAINIVLGIIVTIAFTGMIAAAISGIGNGGYYGGYYF